MRRSPLKQKPRDLKNHRTCIMEALFRIYVNVQRKMRSKPCLEMEDTARGHTRFHEDNWKTFGGYIEDKRTSGSLGNLS